MSKQRIVDTCFWDDPYVIALDPIEKLVFIYLLTNTLTTICGVYEITTKRIAFDTGLDREVIERLLARFERDGRCKYSNGWLAMRNWIKHQRINPSVERGILRELARVPKELADYVTAVGQSVTDSPQSGLPNLTQLNPMGEAEPPVQNPPEQEEEPEADQQPIARRVEGEYLQARGMSITLSDDQARRLHILETKHGADGVIDGFRGWLTRTSRSPKPVRFFFEDFPQLYAPRQPTARAPPKTRTCERGHTYSGPSCPECDRIDRAPPEDLEALKGWKSSREEARAS